MYKKNDLVVYRRDVCKVVDKIKSDMTGEQCYILQPYNQMDGSVRMQVPVSNKGGHLRDVLTKDEVNELIKNVSKIEMLEDKPANMKSQYVALLKEDNLEDLIRIIKTSYQRNKVRADSHKKLAAIDGEYLEKAERYLFTEFAVAMDMTYEDSKAHFIKQILKPTKRTKKK